jgi:excisionase family DNA binding protein
MALERHYSATSLAELLDCSTETIRRAAVSGALRSVRVGADRRFPESAVTEWLEGRRRGGRRGRGDVEVGRVVQLDRRARGA